MAIQVFKIVNVAFYASSISVYLAGIWANEQTLAHTMRVERILFSATVTGSCLLFECHKFAPGCLTSPSCKTSSQQSQLREETPESGKRGEQREGSVERGINYWEHERVRARYFIFISIGKLLVQLPHT